ncbi:MAG: hypothetical protein KIT72_07850 [Polyangiaceae bacterium]|nr:hypothetical protein [Polyangiaceae bacterium]MCW5790318.1 hypothetical protein [Polyangiaceae bacterium]
MRRLPWLGLPAALALCALPGCGAGFEALHESEVRFEHCYRLDLEARAAPTHRLFCWQEWLETHTADQPRDRVRHAERRVASLTAGDDRPEPLVIGEPADAEQDPARALLDDPTQATLAAREDSPGACEAACYARLNECRSGGDASCASEYATCAGRCEP